MRRHRPSYDIERAQQLAIAGKTVLTKRVRKYLIERGSIDLSDITAGVFTNMRQEHFHKTVELDKRPGTYADVYKGIEYDGIEWYVKFFIDGSDVMTLNVWSMCDVDDDWH